MQCLDCDYPLKLLAEHRCPECGRAFNPKDRFTFRAKRRWRDEHPSTILTVWMLSACCMITLLFLAPVIADTSHRWTTAGHMGLASLLLITLAVLTWRDRRTDPGHVSIVACLVIAADLWVLWNTIGWGESDDFRQTLADRAPPVIAWLVAWFAWQWMVLPYALLPFQARRRRFKP